MAFQPSTNIYIGTVPFDNTYRHVYYIPDRNQQYSYFLSCCPNELRRSDYTYQRTQNAVVVPYNAEQLYGYNYCMFQNSNYGSRWFYSFITDIEYVNESSSRLYLQLDIFQTWFPDCNVPACNVEREHVNDDTIGAHIKDEGLNPGEMKIQWWQEDALDMWLAVSSACEPLNDGTYVNVSGDNYQNLPSGTSVTVFDPDTQIGEFKRFMNALSDNGQQDAVSSVYMVPAQIVPGLSSKDNGVGGAWIDASKPTRYDDIYVNLEFTNLNGYVPKNNKLFCYPFEYCEVSNIMGQNQQFRLEFMHEPGVLHLTRTGGTDSSSRTLYFPREYNGSNWFYEGVITMPPYATCNWVYQTWANAEGRAKIAEIDYTSSVVQRDAGTGEAGPGQQVGVNNGSFDLNAMTNVPYMEAVLGGVERMAGGNLIGGVVGMAKDSFNVYSTLSQKQRMPNTSRGGTNSSAVLVNTDSYRLIVRKYVCRAEIAKQIDDYFSTYGYLVAETKVPNIVGRRSWNYVKTNACNVRGKVPPKVLAAFNSMFDNGITFWHTPDVGNYALDNSIV